MNLLVPKDPGLCATIELASHLPPGSDNSATDQATLIKKGRPSATRDLESESESTPPTPTLALMTLPCTRPRGISVTLAYQTLLRIRGWEVDQRD